MFVFKQIHGFLLFVFIYIYWCPTEFPYQMRLATGQWLSQGTPVTGATSRAWTV